MPYTTNPNLPRVRFEAAQLVFKEGWSTRAVARHTGYDHSTIVRWVTKAQLSNQRTIPTQSSRPHNHPQALSLEVTRAIIQCRLKHRRCAEVIHHLLNKDGIMVSLSSVKRTLRRNGLVNHSKWKKWHIYPERPNPEKPGILVEVDTIHDGPHSNRLYVYTLLDVCSRWAWAWPSERISTHYSLGFVDEARAIAPFLFHTLQSDHGPEFSKWFTKRLTEQGLAHRHSRVRTPNDNGHLERFNRTIQEECLARCGRSLSSWQRAIPEYLAFYNRERPHLALDMQSPLEVVQSY